MSADIDRGPRSSRRRGCGSASATYCFACGCEAVQAGTTHADQLVRDGKVVRDDRGAWTEHQPSAAEEHNYIEDHGLDA